MGKADIFFSDVKESDQPKRSGTGVGRKDRKRLHATHHGMLSKSPLQTLADRGENVRQLRRIERQLRTELRPVGVLGEVLFDRLFSSYLRCVLISQVEGDFFSNDGSTSALNSTTTLPTLVPHAPDGSKYHFPEEFLRNLAIARKYDSHYCREFYRAFAMLLGLRGGGADGLTREVMKTFPQKGGSGDANDD